MKFNIFFLILVSIGVSCGQNKIVTENVKSTSHDSDMNENNTLVNRSLPGLIYHGSDTVFFDLIHTKLDLRFNYHLKHVIGTAEITLKPYFYPSNVLKLDAQNFDLHEISLVTSENHVPLKYSYDNQIIKIQLDKTYKTNEEFTIFIDYTGKPDEIASTGTWAITDNKGLYFKNADTDDAQIWTQGETQSNSTWFPTIDSPIQNMTQEIYLTVDREYKTLSNGVLVGSLANSDGTRTDYWKQDKPHAPYLVMIAVGKFEIIKDYWRDMPVFVYIEQKDIQKAGPVFKKTSKMIEFYSLSLKYDYPWDKFHQIVVRDFVSGAMENTGAVVFGDYVLDYQNEEQRLEYECIVAHELSHHWFGNLVTCESWANLPLNESFATYFEYLWLEHEYGRTTADIHLEQEYLNYSFERFFKDENLIRFFYSHRDDMFDAHSYQKGAIILHMLRYTVGDVAFWSAMRLYLKEYEYQPVEIHNLRMAFEKVTGTDLNWFFNEWFLNKGIPELNIVYGYHSETEKATITIHQVQNTANFPIYKIPTDIDIYLEDTVIRKPILIDAQNEIYEFSVNSQPLFMNFDPENSILCKKTENYSTEEYIEILDKAPLYKDKNEALNALFYSQDDRLNAIYLKLSKHEYWKFRLESLKRMKIKKNDELYENYISVLKSLSVDDKNTEVRNTALNLLIKSR
jgi:aminopeptidase N